MSLKGHQPVTISESEQKKYKKNVRFAIHEKPSVKILVTFVLRLAV